MREPESLPFVLPVAAQSLCSESKCLFSFQNICSNNYVPGTGFSIFSNNSSQSAHTYLSILLVIAHFISDQYSGREDPISFHLTFIFDGSNFIRTNFLVKFCWYHQFPRHLTWNYRVILYFFTIVWKLPQETRDSYELWMIVWCFWIMDVNISTHSNFQFKIWIICRMHAFNDL